MVNSVMVRLKQELATEFLMILRLTNASTRAIHDFKALPETIGWKQEDHIETNYVELERFKRKKKKSYEEIEDFQSPDLGAVCFFEVKTSTVCGPYLQPSAVEEVDQTSAVCKKKTMLEDLRSGQSMSAPRRGRADLFRSAVFEKTNSLRGKTSARGLRGADIKPASSVTPISDFECPYRTLDSNPASARLSPSIFIFEPLQQHRSSTQTDPRQL
ncbi:hypothetical protein LXL04_005272 [Taraxacum kok-saghyz]